MRRPLVRSAPTADGTPPHAAHDRWRALVWDDRLTQWAAGGAGVVFLASVAVAWDARAWPVADVGRVFLTAATAVVIRQAARARAATAATAAAHLAGSTSSAVAAWRLLAISMALWAGGTACIVFALLAGSAWSAGPELVLVGEVFDVVAQGAMCRAVWRFPAGPRRRDQGVTLALDGAIVLVTALAALWHLAAGARGVPVLRVAPAVRAFQVLFASADLLILFGATRLALRGDADADDPAHGVAAQGAPPAGVVALAALCLCAADFGALHDFVRGVAYAHFAAWSRVGWLAAVSLGFVGARWDLVRSRAGGAPAAPDDVAAGTAGAPAVTGASEPALAAPTAPPFGQRFSALPYAAVAVSYALLFAAARGMWHTLVGQLILSVTLVTALVVARQVVGVRENARLVAARAAERVAHEARFRALVAHSSDGISVLAGDGAIRYLSPAVERWVGDRTRTSAGRSFADLLDADDRSALDALLAAAARAAGPTTPVILRLDDVASGATGAGMRGVPRHLEVVATARLDDPLVAGVVLNSRDVSERVALEAELAYRADHDPLTGLANRAQFRTRADAALTAAHAAGARHQSDAHERRRDDAVEVGVAALYIDLDDFKTVNDSLGHQAGDQLLTEVAQRLRAATRGSDTVARLGGDEFAVLLAGVRGAAEAVHVAERITAALRAPIALDVGSATTSPSTGLCPTVRRVTVGASIGVALAAAGEGPDELLRNADAALYAAKRAGKCGHALYDPAMHRAALERLSLESDLRHAVAVLGNPNAATDPVDGVGPDGAGRLTIAYQPLADLATGRTVGVEALARWQHPRRGAVPPDTFIPIAEETGLIVPLGRWVLREACRHGARWRAAQRLQWPASPPPTIVGSAAGAASADRFTVTVNVSGRQLRTPGFVADVADALAAAGLPAACLTLELTERVVVADGDDAGPGGRAAGAEDGRVVARLHALKALGVRLAVDDFGTGHSALGYLRRLPVDVLKIDRTFTAGLGGPAQNGGGPGGRDAALARAVVALGEALGLATVAEGVERGAQRDALWAMGCRVGQGYYFARPLAPDAVDALLAAETPTECPDVGTAWSDGTATELPGATLVGDAAGSPNTRSA